MSGGALFVPAQTLRLAAKQYGTPFYVYDEAGLRRNTAQALAAFSWNGGFSLYFPVRWNRNAEVLRILRESGCGAECSDRAELALAERCGFSGGALRYAPRRVDAAGEQLAARLGAEVVLDDPALRPGFVPQRVVLRVWPGERLCWHGRTVAQCGKSKFGMTKREAFYLADYYLAQGTEVGFGLWLAESGCDAGLYPAEARLLLDWMREFYEITGKQLACCDLGAGPGVSGCGEAPETELSQIGALVREAAGQSGIPFSAAPGAWLAGRAGMLVTRVLTVKERERPHVVLDVPGPVQLPGSGRQAMRVLGRRMDAVRSLRLCDVSGCGPSLHDRISERQVLPPVKAGDLMVLEAVGVHLPTEIPEAVWADGALRF